MKCQTEKLQTIWKIGKSFSFKKNPSWKNGKMVRFEWLPVRYQSCWIKLHCTKPTLLLFFFGRIRRTCITDVGVVGMTHICQSHPQNHPKIFTNFYYYKFSFILSLKFIKINEKFMQKFIN